MIFHSITKGVKCSVISVFHLHLDFVVRLGYHEPCEAGDVTKRRKKTAEWVGLDVSSYRIICFLSLFFVFSKYIRIGIWACTINNGTEITFGAIIPP